MNNKESALFYLEALRDDFHRAANRSYFEHSYVSYRDLSVREAQLTTAIAIVRNEFAQVPVEEPTDEELVAIASRPVDIT